MRAPIVRVVTVSCVALLAALLPAVSEAQTVWSANQHTYQVVNDDVTWETARAAAEAAGGYLATMTSAAENGWLTTTFGASSLNLHWIGGFQPEGSDEPDGGWRWVTGEAFSYDNWSGGEPNNVDDDEWVIGFNDQTTADGSTWNDAWSGEVLRGYVIEWDAPNVPALDPRGLVALAVLVAAGAFVALRARG
jgi:hypothetical protein